jgi:mRNA-degrading endonuclease YafQ of YafQ-DinJ toxin-antitoxin module
LSGKKHDGREATFDFSSVFQEKFEKYKKSNPKISGKIKEFVNRKKKRPPEKMPGEHKLNPPFDGVLECHLEGDLCLLFRDKSDKVSLLTIATHDEMAGRRGKGLAKQFKKSG